MRIPADTPSDFPIDPRVRLSPLWLYRMPVSLFTDLFAGFFVSLFVFPATNGLVLGGGPATARNRCKGGKTVILVGI